MFSLIEKERERRDNNDPKVCRALCMSRIAQMKIIILFSTRGTHKTDFSEQNPYDVDGTTVDREPERVKDWMKIFILTFFYDARAFWVCLSLSLSVKLHFHFYWIMNEIIVEAIFHAELEDARPWLCDDEHRGNEFSAFSLHQKKVGRCQTVRRNNLHTCLAFVVISGMAFVWTRIVWVRASVNKFKAVMWTLPKGSSEAQFNFLLLVLLMKR